MRKLTLILLLMMLTGCSSATPAPVTVNLDTEFTLAPDQTATLTDTNLTVHLIGVAGDERCPSEIECAVSGPVSVSLEVQLGDTGPTEINLQVFTSDNGRAPDMQFEGIKDRAVYAGYLIRMVGVLPYPAQRNDLIRDSEYRVTLILSQEQ